MNTVYVISFTTSCRSVKPTEVMFGLEKMAEKEENVPSKQAGRAQARCSQNPQPRAGETARREARSGAGPGALHREGGPLERPGRPAGLRARRAGGAQTTDTPQGFTHTHLLQVPGQRQQLGKCPCYTGRKLLPTFRTWAREASLWYASRDTVLTGTVSLHLLPSLAQHFCSSISRGEPPLPAGQLSSPAPLQASSPQES